MNNIPKDPVMLLSYINTQLRDNYSSLDEFCISFLADKKRIEESLDSIDYKYNATLNKFI